MPATTADQTKLTTEESREMKQLTDELTSVLNKMSRVVLPHAGMKGNRYTEVDIILPTAGNPLQIGFKNAKIFSVQKAPKQAQDEGGIDVGYYEDPPGICTSIPACFGG